MELAKTIYGLLIIFASLYFIGLIYMGEKRQIIELNIFMRLGIYGFILMFTGLGLFLIFT